ncbi:Cytochrome b-c1 complex subunit 9 [Ananas comosus]|uniref:Complex III subunit 9 n=1 Tax=Ananas comosus TaxID=4615 RepID=A0A199VYV3_ANACO|nr:Cytochrome b-c1 complex subunit 9 [Ananas comosus]
MDSAAAARRGGGGGGLWDGLYRVLMRRNSVYVTFVVAGAFIGERMVDYGVHKLWDYNNVGIKSCYKFHSSLERELRAKSIKITEAFKLK